MRIDHAKRARAFVGARFRPQGRNPGLGLDCVGLVLCAFDLPGELARRDYRMRGPHRRELMRALAGPFRRIARTRLRAGDILLLQVRSDQLHLAIVTSTGVIPALCRRLG